MAFPLDNATPVRALLVDATNTPVSAGGGSIDITTLAKDATLTLLLTALLAQAAKTDTQPVSAASLPLPTGAASESKLEAVRALLAGGITVNTGNSDPATGARQTTANTSLSSIDTKTPALVSGRVPVDGSGVTQPVSAAALPLPAGAATSANQSSELTKLDTLHTDLTAGLTRAAQAPITDTLTIAASASVSGSVNLTGKSVLRLLVGSAWTTAVITVQVSADGSTWYDLYDESGNVYTVQAAASRAIGIAPGVLLGVNYLRLRSGTPASAVTQASAATISVISVPL